VELIEQGSCFADNRAVNLGSGNGSTQQVIGFRERVENFYVGVI
jgi:hypothetical protein